MRRGLSPSIKPGLLLAILFVALASTGCQTTVGNYLGNRGRDLGHCFKLQAGLGFGLGADVHAAGLVHLGAMMAWDQPQWTVGWNYGELRPGRNSGGNPPGDEHVNLLMLHASEGMRAGGGSVSHHCYRLLPGIFSWRHSISEKERLWSEPDTPGIDEFNLDDLNKEENSWVTSEAVHQLIEEIRESELQGARWSRVHAFDIEASVTVLFLSGSAGFSPGEFVDFFLGWFGVDIAGDDQELRRETLASPEENGNG